MGEPYGHLIARCGKCGGSVDVHVESNGEGGLVDIIEPCPRCLAPRMVMRPIQRPRSVRPLVGIRRTSPLMILALAKARSLVERGDLATAKIAALTGISQDAVRRIRREIEEVAPKLCGCGKSWNHGGRCSWRRQREEG